MINIDCNVCSRGLCEITNLFTGTLCRHYLLWFGEESSNLVRSESGRNNVVLGSVSSSRIFIEPRQLGESQQQISCSSYINSSPGASNVTFGKDYEAIFAPCCNQAWIAIWLTRVVYEMRKASTVCGIHHTLIIHPEHVSASTHKWVVTACLPYICHNGSHNLVCILNHRVIFLVNLHVFKLLWYWQNYIIILLRSLHIT